MPTLPAFVIIKYMTVFVIAMQSEAESVLACMQSVEKQTVHSRTVARGTLCGKPAAVVICGVGKVNAACGAQYAIDCLGADKIINIGVAGGLNDGMSIAAVYEMKNAVQYDFDLVQINGTTIGTLNEFKEPYLPFETVSLYPSKSLATGDRFNDSREDFLLLTKELKADIRDMEGGAILHACVRAGVKCYSFKAISDLAGSGSTTEQFLQNLNRCNEALKEAVPAIFEEING